MTTPDPREPAAPATPEGTPARALPTPAADRIEPHRVVREEPDVDGTSLSSGRVEARADRRRLAVVACTVALVVAALGAVVGWVWYAVAPALPVIKDERGLLYANPEPEQPVATDGLFVFFGLGVGIAVAVLAWVLLRRYRGVAVLMAITIGSLGAGVLAVWVGHWIAVHEFTPIGRAATNGTQLNVPVMFLNRLWTPRRDHGSQPPPSGLIATQAVAAAFAYTCLAGFSSYPDLGRRRSRPANDGADSDAS